MSDRCAHRYPARPDGQGIGCPQCLAEGRAERDKGLATTVSTGPGKWDLAVVLNAIKPFAESGEPFTADDIRPLLPKVGSQVIGAGFNVARRRGLIECVGYQQSTNPSRHASVTRVWVGTKSARRTA
jgi:hypothetical protein